MESVERDRLIIRAMQAGIIEVKNQSIIRRYVNRHGKQIVIEKKTRRDKDGYLMLDFSGINGRRIKAFVHRLVWLWYSRQPVPEEHSLHHIDGNKRNNDYENLQPLTLEEHGRISMADLPEF